MPTAFQIDVHPFTDRGQRDYQEDFFYTDPPAREGAPWLGAVADGMGGHVRGDIASRNGILALKQAFDAAIAARLGTAEALAQAATSGHEAVLVAARNANAQGNMGSTVVAFAVDGTRLYWCSAGDSRIYLCRAGQAEQLTRDFTLAEDMRSGAQQGAWSEADIQANPQRNALTSFMGTDHWRHHDGSRTLEVGDVVVACSDGVYGSIGNEGIRDACAAADAKSIAEDMLRRVLAAAKPHQDNSTAVVVRIAGPRAGHALARHDPSATPAPQGSAMAKWAGLACVAALATTAGVLVYRSEPARVEVAGPGPAGSGAAAPSGPTAPPAPSTEAALPVPAALVPAPAPTPAPVPAVPAGPAGPAALRPTSAAAGPTPQERVGSAIAALRVALKDAGVELTKAEQGLLKQIEAKPRAKPPAPAAQVKGADNKAVEKKTPPAPSPAPPAAGGNAPTLPPPPSTDAGVPRPPPPPAPPPAPTPAPAPTPSVPPTPPPAPPAPTPPPPPAPAEPQKQRGGSQATGELGPS